MCQNRKEHKGCRVLKNLLFISHIKVTRMLFLFKCTVHDKKYHTLLIESHIIWFSIDMERHVYALVNNSSAFNQ